MCCPLISGLMLTRDQFCFLSLLPLAERRCCALPELTGLHRRTDVSVSPASPTPGVHSQLLASLSATPLSPFRGPRPPPCSEHSSESLLASQLHPLLNPLQSCFHFTLQGCGGLPSTMSPPPRVTLALAPWSSWHGQTPPPSCPSSLTSSLI